MSVIDLILNKRPEPIAYDPEADHLAQVLPEEEIALPAHTRRCGQREVRAQIQRVKFMNLLADLKFDANQTRFLLLFVIGLLIINNTIDLSEIVGWFIK